MKLEELISKAENITTLNRLNEIIQQPRTGKIYSYHEGMIAEDKVLNKKYKGLTEAVVKEAFNWDDNFVKIEKGPSYPA